MAKILCPSMMCADFEHLIKEVEQLDQAGIDIYHCDVMDGLFVPNLTMGIMDIKTICQHTKKMVDVHLMIENPYDKVQWFIDVGVDLIYIHPESERYVIKTLQKIKQQNVKAGIAINPDTNVSVIEDILPYCDYVMVMSVHPGFAGQKFMNFVEHKVERLVQLKKDFDYKLMMDGACSPAIIEKYSAMGVDGFVLGTSALFQQHKPYQQLVDELQKL